MFKKEVLRDDNEEYTVAVTSKNNTVTMFDGRKGKDIVVKYAIVFDVKNLPEWTGEDMVFPFWLTISLVPYQPISRKTKEKIIDFIGLPEGWDDEYALIEGMFNYGYEVPINPEFLKIEDSDIVMIFQHNSVVFKTWEDAEHFINEYADDYADAIVMMSGFLLDRHLNKIGTIGWDIFEEVAFGY